MIFYHKTSYGIVFWIDEVISREISEWNRNIKLTSKHFASLQDRINFPLDYFLKLHLTLLEGEIAIDIERNNKEQITIDRFSQVFEARQAQNTLFMDEAVQFLHALDSSKAFILETGFLFYKELTNQRCWIEDEAFSGRYRYNFYYYVSSINSNSCDVDIYDTQTGAIFEPDLDYMDYFQSP